MPVSQTIVSTLANGTIDRKTYDANGQLSFEQLDYKNGTHEQKSFLIKGAAYTRTDSFFDSSWRITSQVQYRADGSILDVMARSYAANGSTTTTHSDANGLLLSKEIANADGSHIQTTYQIKGMNYTAQEISFDAAWRITKKVFYAADGSISSSQSLSYAANGDLDTKFYDSTGALTLEQIDKANGTHQQLAHQILGKAYTDSSMVFDAKWRLTDMVLYAADHSIYSSMHGVYNADGSDDLRYYDAKGNLTAENIDNADGSHIQRGVASSGAFKTFEYDFDKNWKLTQLVQNNLDGTNTIKGFTDGLTLKSSGLGNDILTGGGKNETFALGSNCGREIITDFITSGSGHDILALSKSLVADWTHLLADLHQMGNDLQIVFDAKNSVTLKNVTVAQLVSSDVTFV